MNILIFGAGNLILSDEGFGVHFVNYMAEHYFGCVGAMGLGCHPWPTRPPC